MARKRYRPMSEDELQQHRGVTTRAFRARLYEAARFRYNLLDAYGPLPKARTVAKSAWNIARGKRILFFPEDPVAPTSILQVCLWAGHRIVTDPAEAHDAVFKWWDATFTPNSELPEWMLALRHVVNLRCQDISKAMVGRAFEGSFGYPIDVDPTTYRGRCLEKSDENAKHDGRIVECPISAPRPGCVYEKLVDNRMDSGMYGVFRVPVFAGEIPYVALGHRAVEQRFGVASFSTFMEPTEGFSATELAQMTDMCARMGLDYGELDVLRDRDDGRVYVCDVNSTPWGGTALRRLPKPYQREALSRLARCLDRLTQN